MDEADQDFDLIVKVRLYGGGTAGEAAAALRDSRSGFDLPGDREVEILDAALAESVPVPVLEALASAWEDQAEHGDGSTSYAGDPSGPNHRDTLAACARMLREAITHGGQG